MTSNYVTRRIRRLEQLVDDGRCIKARIELTRLANDLAVIGIRLTPWLKRLASLRRRFGPPNPDSKESTMIVTVYGADGKKERKPVGYTGGRCNDATAPYELREAPGSARKTPTSDMCKQPEEIAEVSHEAQVER